jgi:hypothetical protein
MVSLFKTEKILNVQDLTTSSGRGNRSTRVNLLSKLMTEIDKQLEKKNQKETEEFGYCFRIRPNEIDPET